MATRNPGSTHHLDISVGISHYLLVVSYMSGGCLGFLNHQQNCPPNKKSLEIHSGLRNLAAFFVDWGYLATSPPDSKKVEKTIIDTALQVIWNIKKCPWRAGLCRPFLSSNGRSNRRNQGDPGRMCFCCLRCCRYLDLTFTCCVASSKRTKHSRLIGLMAVDFTSFLIDKFALLLLPLL